MKSKPSKIMWIAGLSVLGMGIGLNEARALQPPRPAGEDGVQVLTRGPVHEAFAATVTYDPEPGIVVNVAPPAPIEEVPPDQRPEGVNVAWIPGYTAWDDERQDYLWISGVWRAPPPGRQWIPGYWGRTSQGFQWISGYWADAQLNEIEYLPEPPETVEAGPSIPAPSTDHSWIPGSWVWRQDRYVWRPGYWVTAQPDWDWIPSHFTWAPRGYIYVDGYWDHSVERRGVLFAPVYFEPGIYARRNYHYSPSMVISLNVFSDHLFVRPRYQHYYFGDYYDSGYYDAGFYSRSAFQSSRRGYDPIYARQRWTHRNEHDWEQRVDEDFRHRRDNADARPPRTVAQLTELRLKKDSVVDKRLELAAPLERWATQPDNPVPFRQVNNDEKQALVERGKELQRFRDERRVLETQAVEESASDSKRITPPARVKLPRPVIAVKSTEETATVRTPPRRPEAPQPDLKVEPKQRKPRPKAQEPRREPRNDRADESRDEPKGKSKKDKSRDDD